MAMNKLLPAFGFSALLLSSVAQAAPPAPAPAEPAQPHIVTHPGPEKLSLDHGITVNLPAEDIFVDAANAKPLLEKDGNFMGENFLGMVVPKDPSQHWWASIEYADEGYVKDDEKIDADDLLKQMKEGQDQNNEFRKEKGFGPMFLDRWSEPPHYDKAEHKLVWALELHVVENNENHPSVNFETRMLGRRGYVSETLICKPENLAAYKPAIEALLKSSSFEEGSKYSNFDSKTDKVATYGLLGLIGAGAGIAALKVAKIGIFAKLLPFLAKGAKAIALLFVALFGKFKSLFTGKKKKPQPAAPPSMVNAAGSAPPKPDEPTPAPHSAPSHDPTDDFK